MASRSLNKVMLIGNLGRDAETRFTPSGVARTTFSLATSRRTKNPQTGEWRDDTEWHNVVLWRAENLANYLQKGKQVYIEGRLQTRSWEDQTGNRRYRTEVVAESVMLLGRARGDDVEPPVEAGPEQRAAPPQPTVAGSAEQKAAASAGEGSTPGESADQGITDDDVPF